MHLRKNPLIKSIAIIKQSLLINIKFFYQVSLLVLHSSFGFLSIRRVRLAIISSLKKLIGVPYHAYVQMATCSPLSSVYAKTKPNFPNK